MSRMNVRRSVVMLFVIGMLVGGLYANLTPNQRAEAAQEDPLPKKRYYYGEEMCSKCHNMPVEQAKKEVPEEEAILYSGMEMHIWIKKDKHKNATKVLSDVRALQMEKNLSQMMENKATYKVAKDAQCLSCHGVYVKDEKEADKKTFSPKQRVESGVTCVACHGASSKWVNEHSKAAESVWRDFTRQEKETNWDLNDLWDPAKRAALCSSCHVGNVKEGKVVTHEMYAAGHPPLPGIEIATFGNALPRHWETLTEKIHRRPQHKDFYKAKHGFDPGKSFDETMEQTQMVAIAAVSVFKASMDLIATHADIHAKKKNADGWPEFAMYDCYACHHDLKSDSWRLENPSSGVAGRPGARTWSNTLLPLVIGQDKTEKKNLADKLKKLDAAFTKTPFGQPGEIATTAKELADWSDSLLKSLEKKKFAKADSTALLKAMFERADAKSLDFDSARQLGWATQALVGELHPDALKPKEDPKIPGTFDGLSKLMSLKLPDGQVPIVGSFLTEAMENMGKYEPKVFRAEMKKIAQSVKQP